MNKTIRHNDKDRLVVVAKLLTRAVSVTKKVHNPGDFITKHETFDAGFVATVCTWQRLKGLTPDGIIGPATWTAIAKAAPTCSTSKLKTSAPTLALQLLLDGNITPDGIYGPRTKAAVAAFQTAAGLKADGVCGPKTWTAIIVGASETPVTPTPGKFTKPVDYKQYDSRWGSKMYSSHGDKKQTMANSACGPTAMADIIATIKDAGKTPYDLAQLAIKFGDRTYNRGTAWSFFIPHIMDHFGFKLAIKTATLAGLKACLDAGGYAVCSMGPGYWTSGGHFICAWKYDDEYIYCNDPASAERTNQSIAQFMKERKQFFCFYREEPIHQAQTTSAAPPTTQQQKKSAPTTGATGTEIIDISKWQGTIDFDKLRTSVSFVIARAGVGSDPDPMFEKYAEAMKARGIPFGVYCYSYAATEAKARDEAQKLVARAGKYSPLFYVIDAEESKLTNAAIKAFADELRKQGAKRIGCYVAHNHYKDYGYDTIRSLYDFTWIPRYGKNTGTIEGSTKPSYKCDLWQYTSTGNIAGITGRVDKNTITGQGKSLAWFLGGE